MRYDQGSLDRAYFGEYTFSISKVLSEARERSRGAKFIILSSSFIYIALASLLHTFFSLFLSVPPSFEGSDTHLFLSEQAITLLSMPVLLPLFVGIIMMGLKRAGDQKVHFSNLFDYFVDVWQLVLASVLMNLLIVLGLLLFILPGIYLSIAYAFTLPLMIDKRLGIWEAMELSRKAVGKRWFKFFIFTAWMSSVIDFHQLVNRDMSIFFSCPYRSVPQHALNSS